MSRSSSFYQEKYQRSHGVAANVKLLASWTGEYLVNLVPIVNWLPRYNRQWMIGDLVAGVTVGLMVVPQSLAYAKLANLPVVYGLYSSFVGTMVYSLTGTCREIAVGPAAVLSLMVGSVVTKLTGEFPGLNPVSVAALISFLSGLITLGLGLFNLGLILDWIPHPVIMGFTSGSALIIILSQLPNLLGIPNVPSSDPTITIIRNLFSNIIKLNYPDLTFGLLSILFLMGCTHLSRRFTQVQYLGVASNALCVFTFTIISFIINTTHTPFNLKLVGAVPQGLPSLHLPELSHQDLITKLLPEMIPVILVGVLEHVSIAKSFAKLNNYKLVPSQELVALGLGNFLTSFVGGYPATGSFSRTAVNSRSGVRTPMSAMVTGLVVILALSVLTPAFYYIPSATLSGIIVLSAKNLVINWKDLRKLFRLDAWEGLSFTLAMVVTLLFGAELGIGCSMLFSLLVLLFRLSRPSLITNPSPPSPDALAIPPLTKDDGWFLFQPQGDLLFTSIDSLTEQVIQIIKANTQGPSANQPKHKLWNDRSSKEPPNQLESSSQNSLPKLNGVILDFSGVGTVDGSGLHGLSDLIKQLKLHANYSSPSEFDITLASDSESSHQLEIKLVIPNDKVLRSVIKANILSESDYFYSLMDALAATDRLTPNKLVTTYSIKQEGDFTIA